MSHPTSTATTCETSADDASRTAEMLVPASSGVPLAILCLIVAGLVMFAHWPVLKAQALTFDDSDYLTDNVLVQHPSWASAGQFLVQAFKPSTVGGYYQPLAMISLMLDYAIAGQTDDLRPFHRTSLALHVANAVLVTLFLYALFGATKPAGQLEPEPAGPVSGGLTARMCVAGMAGLLFGVHPLTVEPVAWLAERKTLLAAFFALSSLTAYVWSVRRQSRPLLGGSLILYVLALMSKPTSAPLPVMMLLLDHWPLGRFSKRAVAEKVPFFVVAAAFGAITVISQAHTASVELPSDLPVLRFPFLICYDVAFYVSKWLLPVNLSSVYMLPEPLTWPNGVVALSVGFTAASIAGIVISWRRAPVWGVGALIFLVGIIPTLGFVKYSWFYVADKYAYLPAIGPLVILYWLLQHAWTGRSDRGRTFRRLATVATVLLATGVLAVGTRRCLGHWRGTEARIDYMLNLAPRSPQLHYVCGNLNAEKGLGDLAIQEYTSAIDLKPDFAAAFGHRGSVFDAQGDGERAIRDYTRAIELNPKDVASYDNRGNTYSRRGDYEQAIRDYTKAIQLTPNNTIAFCNRATAYANKGDNDQAVRDCTKAIELDPGHAPAYNNRGVAHYRDGNFDQAIRDYTRAIELEPDQPQTYNNRGNSYFAQDNHDAAIGDYNRAIQLDPLYATAYLNRGRASLAKGDQHQAIKDCNRAIELRPDLVSAYDVRGMVYFRLGEYDKAWSDARTCRQLGGRPSPDLIQALSQVTSRSE